MNIRELNESLSKFIESYEVEVYTVNKLDDEGNEVENPDVKLVDKTSAKDKEEAHKLAQEMAKEYTKEDDVEVLIKSTEGDTTHIEALEFLQED